LSTGCSPSPGGRALAAGRPTPPVGRVAAGRLWQYLNTYRTHCFPDPLPTHLVTPYVFQKKF